MLAKHTMFTVHDKGVKSEDNRKKIENVDMRSYFFKKSVSHLKSNSLLNEFLNDDEVRIICPHQCQYQTYASGAKVLCFKLCTLIAVSLS